MAKANATTTSKSLSFLQCKNNSNNTCLSSFTSKTFCFSFNFKKPPPLLSLPSFSSSSQPPRPCFPITRVTTVPLEYAVPAPDSNFHQELSRLKSLRSKLSGLKSLDQKLLLLDSDSRVKHFFSSHRNGLSKALALLNLDLHELFLLKCLVAAGQEHVLNLGFELVESEVESARSSVKSALYSLVEMIERFDLSEHGGKVSVQMSHGAFLYEEEIADLRKLLKTLGEIEKFYDCIGGIIG